MSNQAFGDENDSVLIVFCPFALFFNFFMTCGVYLLEKEYAEPRPGPSLWQGPRARDHSFSSFRLHCNTTAVHDVHGLKQTDGGGVGGVIISPNVSVSAVDPGQCLEEDTWRGQHWRPICIPPIFQITRVRELQAGELSIRAGLVAVCRGARSRTHDGSRGPTACAARVTYLVLRNYAQGGLMLVNSPASRR